jgi:hypothetical protein
LQVRVFFRSFAKAVALFALLTASADVFSQASGSGKPAPDMRGPAPRMANGKPSFAGLWSTTRRSDVTDGRIPGSIAELPYTEWGRQQWENYDAHKNGDYAGSCLPFGFPRSIFGPHPTQIIQDNDYIVFLFEQNSMFHIVPIDGRGFNPELPPSWFGESIGRWDGDTLIIESRNLNGYAKIDTIGHPLSDQAKITQTLRRPTFGTIEHTFTVDDPKTYTRPWTVTNTWPQEAWGTVLMEYACMESGLDSLLSGAVTPWRPPDDQQ